MKRSPMIMLAAGLAACLCAPAMAQRGGEAPGGQPSTGMRFSDSFEFLKAVRSRDAGVVERILSNPASSAINTRDSDTGEGALHILTRGRDLTWLSFMLGRGARPDLQARDGSTALGLAASIGWVDGARQLIARGANVNLGNSRGETPLILAVHARQPDMVRLLITQGADPNRQDSAAGYSALDYARRDARDGAIARLLEAAPARQPRQVVGPTR
jgi:ankyrin repeat protein